MDNEIKEDLNVKEASDGSAVVDLPSELAKEDSDEQFADGGEASSEAAADAAEEVGKTDDEIEALRAARRNKRKAKRELQKRTSEEKDQRIQMLERQIQQVTERLSVTEKRTHSAELGRIDKAIEDAELKMQYARMKMSEATSAGDGEAMAKAQDMWYEARRNAESLKSVKEQAVKVTQSGGVQEDTREMQRLASAWMEQNDWYDPSGNDEDSEIAKTIDQRMVREGWNPNTKDYWNELNRRLSKRLPHLYNDDQDERLSRKPRQVVTSSGRDRVGGAGSQSVVIPPEMVRSMKDAGLWENKERRQRVIKEYLSKQRNA
jgi:flagellar hook-basal body complex protein FliE